MTVFFGNTIDAYVVNAAGVPTRGLIVTLFVDAARTTPATGLTDEDGTVSDSGQAPAGNRVPGTTVTSKSGGVLSFGAPDGTTVLYYNRGDGVSSRLFKQGGTGSGGTTITRDPDTNAAVIAGS